jgi:CRISPR system Cascade subunit CasD
MPDFMVWQMAGPIVSWGKVAVGEKRLSDSEPTRSALVGLLAACLGIERTDEDNLITLSNTLGVASAVLTDPSSTSGPGPLRDFHTIQTAKPRGKKGQINVSRAGELDDPGDTILSERFYLTGGLFLGCVWLRPSPLVSLQVFCDAMKRPVFSPYLGRRACAPGIPFAPRIIGEEGCDAAMHDYLADGRTAGILGGKSTILRMAWDLDSPGTRPRADQRYRRRDLTVSFQRRQFIERDECMTINPEVFENSEINNVEIAIPTEEEMFNGLPE